MTDDAEQQDITPTKSGADDRDVRLTREMALIFELARGATRYQAAQAAGFHERTVSRRMNDPAFMSTVEKHRQELIERAVGVLADSAAVAALELRRLCESAKSESVRARACKTILDFIALRAALEARHGQQAEKSRAPTAMEMAFDLLEHEQPELDETH